MKKLAFLILIITSCEAEKEPMDVWENNLANQLKAQYIDLYLKHTTTSIDGGPLSAEDYLELDVYDSEVLNAISVNDRVLTGKCDRIKDSILEFAGKGNQEPFNEIRINIIQTNGFWFLKSKKIKTISYRVN